jgi:hypothetical protein
VTEQKAIPLFGAETARRPSILFCGHCGRAPSDNSLGEPPARVCRRCGMGLVLTAPADAAPAAADPFLVVDASLTVCAMSRHAERLLDISETDAVNRHIGEFLVPAEADSTGSNLASLLTRAVRDDLEPSSVAVRPANTFGVRYWARIGPCGPPRAALVVLADAG